MILVVILKVEVEHEKGRKGENMCLLFKAYST